MTVFHVNIVKNDGEPWEIGQGRDVYFTDAYWRIETFIGFLDELVDDSVLEQVHGDHERYQQGDNRKREVKKDAFEPFQD